MNNVSLYSVTPDTGGIFSALDSFSVPWKNTVNAELIDLQYYGNVSGEKIISPLVYKNLSEGKLTETKQALIASMIFSMFGTNWTKEWNTLSMQYDPIANYDMTEIMTDDETVTEYGKTHTKTGTETDAPNLTVSTSDTVHGFNSSNAVPTDARSQGTSGSDITTYDTSDADSGEDTQTRNYELTRKGNIGVTSSQQLLESERNLWMWNYFLDVVFPDVDKILTIPIYADPEEYAETGIVPTGTISINENGLQIDVTQYAFADVAVPNTYTVDDQGKVVYGDLLIGQTSRTITENGEYDTTLNNDCNVNVPNTYTPSDEGKVVSSGALVAQTSLTITEDGEYDTTENNTCIVNVPKGATVISGTNDPTISDGSNGDMYMKYIDYGTPPEGYVFVEYIETTGTQYINTGIGARVQLKIDVDCQWLGSGDQTAIGGSSNSNTNAVYLGFNTSNSSNYFGYNNSWNDTITGAVDNNRHKWSIDLKTALQEISVDGVIKKTTQLSFTETTSTTTLYIGARSNGGSPFTGKIFDVIIFDYVENEVVRHFIPAKRTIDDVIGLYDIINNTFYTNIGSGSFSSGLVVEGQTIIDSFVKVNNIWQPLIGSKMADIDL